MRRWILLLAICGDHAASPGVREYSRRIWIGGSDELVRLSKTAVTTVGSGEGLLDDNVTSIYEDRHQVVWLATLIGQLY